MSTETPLRRIKSVEAQEGFRLAVTWEQERGRTIVDLSDLISQGGVFTALADPATFAAVRIGENNRIVEWPKPTDEIGNPIIEIDADGLFDRARSRETATMAGMFAKLLNETKVVRRRFKAPNPSTR